MNELLELRRCVQGLAQPAEIQVSLFPSFACIGDELALEFDEASRAFQATKARLSPSEATSLSLLDSYISELSGPQNAAFWTDPNQLGSDTRWEHIRALARAVLAAFAWPNEIPTKNGAIYIAESGFARNE